MLKESDIMATYTATYSPDDNKPRLYASTRLDPETYARVRAAGFIWAPKQDLFVAPMWTPSREDLLIELAGEIDDEDTSLVDRAEDRADRFADYSDKRAGEAESASKAVERIAEGIPLGQPILVGHHSERRARKDAERIRSGMQKTIRLWETSGYWKSRAAAATRHAKYKELPAVRARRIKGLEADQRKHEREKKEAESNLRKWTALPDLRATKSGAAMTTREIALRIANYAGGYMSFKFPLVDYPRDAPASQYEGDMSIWSALDGNVVAWEQARHLVMPVYERNIAYCDRWLAHLANRLEYERAMMAESGGTATDKTAPEVGGAVRCWNSPGHGRAWAYIQKVNKVSVTIRVALSYTAASGRTFVPSTAALHEIKGIMSAAEIAEARGAGLLAELPDGVGFALRSAAPLEAREPAAPQPIAEAVDAMRDSLKAGITVAVANQLFPTPSEIAEQVIEAADIKPDHRVLEPSAGTGRLLDPIFSADGTEWRLGKAGQLVAVEINGALAKGLRRQYVAADVREADFLQCNSDLGTFDRIVMNPPFENGADIKHIRHAARMLKPGGRLVAICANGPRQQEQLKPLASEWRDLPTRSFKASGTAVNTALLIIDA